MRWLIFLLALLSFCPKGADMPAPETFVPAMLGYWRADTLSGSNMTDLSGAGRTMTATSMSYSTTSTGDGWGVNGKAVAVLSGSGYFTAASAAPWTPLHNGLGASIWAIFRPTHSGKKVLIDTGAFAINVPGMYVWIDGDRGRIGLDFTNNPENSGRIIDYNFGEWWTWNGTIEMGVPHVLVVTIGTSDTPDIHIWLDGHLVASLSLGDRQKGHSELIGDDPLLGTGPERVFATADPGFPLRIGAVSSAAIFVMSGELAELGTTSAIVSTADRVAIEDWASSNYGVTLDRTEPGIILWDGNSLVDNIWRQNQFPELVTPNLRRQPQRNIMRAIAGLESNQMITRAPKHVTPMYDSTRPFRILVAWEMVNDIANGGSVSLSVATFKSYCQARQAEGWRVVIGTPPPHRFESKSTYDDLVGDVRADWTTFADALADVASDPILGDYDAMIADYDGGAGPKVYRSDGVHFTALGNQMVEPYFTQAINSLLAGRVVVRQL